jgi:ketosteroid isomerase-like protein
MMQNPTETEGATPVALISRRTLLASATALAGSASLSALVSSKAIAEETPMTAEETADIVRRAYHAFNTADLDLFTTLSSDELTWETPGASPIAGLREGREAVYGQFGTYLGGTDGTFKAELHYVTADAEGRAIGVHRNTGMRMDKTLDSMCCITLQVKDGKVVSGKEHFFDLYNWDQFWG